MTDYSLNPIDALRARYHAEERDLVRAALKAEGWSLRGLATSWGVSVSTLQRVLDRHPEVAAERARARARTTLARTSCRTR